MIEKFINKQVKVFNREWQQNSSEPVVTNTTLIEQGLVLSINKETGYVIVKDTYRGEGWNEKHQMYSGISYFRESKTEKVVNVWWRGENLCYNQEFKVHYSQLKIIKS